MSTNYDGSRGLKRSGGSNPIELIEGLELIEQSRD